MAKSIRLYQSKVRSQSYLKKTLSRRARRLRVVFTNGCFDILHQGHVTYLQNARRLGDLLVVGVNSDESVKRLKGPSRPLNALSDRMNVIAALESVDWVTSFEEDTPLNLILKIHPDILVKGGDWKIAQIVGASEVLAWGGKVKTIDFVEGRSTTSLIAKAQKK